MLKKAGLLTVGVTAGLLAVAPIASAGESHDSHEKGDHDKDSSRDHDHGKKHHSKKHHDSDQEGVGNIKCGAEGGDLDNDATGTGLLGIGQVAGPVLSGNTGQLLSCNSFLNDNANDISVNVLSHQLLGDD